MSHLHIWVRNTDSIKHWLESCLAKTPTPDTRTDRLIYEFADSVIVFEQGEIDSRFTLGLTVEHPQQVFDHAVAAGAAVLSEPSIYPSGGFKAYLQGPGGLVIELEGTVR